MDVTSLCSRLLVAVMVLMVAQMSQSLSAHSDVFPRITPDRLQFFEYETVIISCEELMGLTGWRVKTRHNRPTNSDICSPPASNCTIQPAFEWDSGEFWCEDDEGNITGSINISVTAGSVILGLPGHPVTEGSDVTLSCKSSRSQLQHIAEYFRDGRILDTEYTSNMTIRNVSRSHEGFYRCRIPTTGESPESWLAVRKIREKSNDVQSPQTNSQKLHILVWTAVRISLTVVLLLVLGFSLCQKDKGADAARNDLQKELKLNELISLDAFKRRLRDLEADLDASIHSGCFC